MRKITVSNDFFAEAAEALRQGQTVKLLIGGQSMYPFIRGGIDLVEVVPVSYTHLDVYKRQVEKGFASSVITPDPEL